MLDLFGGMSLEAAMLALDMGVFETLDDEPASPAELADRLNADETEIRTFLTFLEHTGYVTERTGTYLLTTMTETWLLESAETSYARYFRFWQEVLYPFWRDHARIRFGRENRLSRCTSGSITIPICGRPPRPPSN